MTYTIAEVAQMTGLSQRALRHYDEIGLVSPDRHDGNLYRRYTDRDISQLHIVRLLREAGRTLEDIRSRLHSPYTDMEMLLEEAKQSLEKERDRIHELLTHITAYSPMEQTHKESIQAHTEAGLDEETVDAYATEAYTRWGTTDAYKQSASRTARYTKADWQRINDERIAITMRVADAMEREVADPIVQAAIGEYYEYMQQFYDCSPEMFRGLGEMYVADPRFKKTYEDIRPGLAEYMKEAMAHFADTA